MKKQIKIAFGMLVCAVLTFVFASVYAAETPTINMTTGGDFYIGESQEFSISTVVPDGYESVTVVGDGGISDTSAIEKLEYYEVRDGNWYVLPEGTQFGGATGFPLTNATSKFKVTFKTAGTYSVYYAVKEVGTGEVIAENTLDIKVVDKSIRDVSTEAELKVALDDANVKVIRLTRDITTTAKINIVRDVIIEGNSHTIKLGVEDNKKWGGHYVLQAYRCSIILNNISLTGGNAGLLINGGTVTVEGILDVSGNGFGGIELAKSGENAPKLDLLNATLKNSSEAYKLPTIWEDPAQEDDILTAGDDALYGTEIKAANGNNQMQYYLQPSNSIDTPENQLKEQLKAEDTDVIITVLNTDSSISKELLNELKEGPERDVIIYAKEYMIEFNTKNITEEFTKDFSLKVGVTEEQPFKSDVLKDVKSDMIFIDLEYSGVLPKGTKLTIDASNFGYAKGDKFMLYYYNSVTDSMELIAKEVVVDDNDFAVVEIDHASTYVLSSKELPTGTITSGSANPETPKTNPDTSDITMFVAITLAVIPLAGFGYVARVKMVNKK